MPVVGSVYKIFISVFNFLLKVKMWTLCNKFLLKKLIVAQLVMEFYALPRTRRPIMMSKRAHHLPASWQINQAHRLIPYLI
jgi:hypothetical protein